MSLIQDPSGETVLVTLRIKKYELAECLRRIPKDGTLQDALYEAFSFGLFAVYELASLASQDDYRYLLQRMLEDWRSPYRRPNDARLMGRTDDELIEEYFGVCGNADSSSSVGGNSATPEQQKGSVGRIPPWLSAAVDDPSGERMVVGIRIKKADLAECILRMPSHRTIHEGLYNAFSFGLFAASDLLSEDSDILDGLLEKWRSPNRKPHAGRPNDRSDDELAADYLTGRAMLAG